MQRVRSGDIQRTTGGSGAELLGVQVLGLDAARGGLQRHVCQLMLAQTDVGAARFNGQVNPGGNFNGQRFLRGGEQAGILRACLAKLDIEHAVKQQVAHLQLTRYAAGDFGRAKGIRAALRQRDGACNPVDFHPLHIGSAIIEIARDVLIGVGIALHARGKSRGAQQTQRKQDGNQKGNTLFHVEFFPCFLERLLLVCAALDYTHNGSDSAVQHASHRPDDPAGAGLGVAAGAEGVHQEDGRNDEPVGHAESGADAAARLDAAGVRAFLQQALHGGLLARRHRQRRRSRMRR